MKRVVFETRLPSVFPLAKVAAKRWGYLYAAALHDLVYIWLDDEHDAAAASFLLPFINFQLGSNFAVKHLLAVRGAMENPKYSKRVPIVYYLQAARKLLRKGTESGGADALIQLAYSLATSKMTRTQAVRFAPPEIIPFAHKNKE